MVLALLGAAAIVVASSSFVLFDTDLWQHLAAGRAVWRLGNVPHANQWTWPQFGEPAFLSSWAFRWMLWPVWSWGGVAALFAWRWVATLALFAVLFATARTMGARRLSAVLVMILAALDYRLRTSVRPENLAALLFAVELWLLERQRRGAPRREAWWIVGIAWAWANTHISYYLGPLLLGIYALAALAATRAGGATVASGRARAMLLLQVGAAAIAVSFLNPFGVTALIQPFEFAFRWRHDPLIRTIGELQPLSLRLMLLSGVWVWPLLAIARSWRRSWDAAEIAAVVVFTALALSSVRFVGTWVWIAAPFVARDLAELLERIPVPRPRAALGVQSVLVLALGALVAWPEWVRPDLPFGVAIDPATYPGAACDFIAAHGIRGRMLNDPHHGGYLAYRFWPDRGRLPFISSQPEYARPEDRTGLLMALVREDGWRALDERCRFDVVLLERDQDPADSLLDFFDRDPRFALVFADDVAELLIRRERFPALVAAFSYRVVPAGRARRYALTAAAESDAALRRAAEAELDRMISSSPIEAGASHQRGYLALMDRDWDGARRHLERALRLDPLLPEVHDALGFVGMAQGRPRDAVRELELECRLHGPSPGIFYRIGLAWQQAGDAGRARAAYRRELARDPGNQAARDSLQALVSRTGRGS
jgi:Flp pilus assembly protein TadD